VRTGTGKDCNARAKTGGINPSAAAADQHSHGIAECVGSRPPGKSAVSDLQRLLPESGRDDRPSPSNWARATELSREINGLPGRVPALA
jgi:hypothetical protein